MTKQVQLNGIITDATTGLRQDAALAQLFPEYSRSQITRWIKSGQVLINNKKIRPRDLVCAGDQVIISACIDNTDTMWTAKAMDIAIVYEDDAILIINKPAGMVVHPGANHYEDTLVNALLHHRPRLAAIPRAGIIHRIDKDTTGLLAIAKTLKAHHSLTSQLQKRNVLREYQAIVTRIMTAGGTIDKPVGRHLSDRKRMAVKGSGKQAITHYRVVKRYRAHTHIRCQLATGRTHQIRVHMAYLHHPLLGDPVYGGRLRLPKNASDATKNVLQGFRRQALHAGLLGFVHPVTKEQVSWQVSPPDDMLAILKVLADDDSNNTT